MSVKIVNPIHFEYIWILDRIPTQRGIPEIHPNTPD